MAKTALPPVRASVRILAFVVPVLLVAVGALSACQETRRTLGDACLKSEDCLSGICTQLVCTAAPPLINDEPVAEGGSTVDATAEAGVDAPVVVEAAPETSTVPEAAPEAAGD
jgi:hypothetical protein